MRYNGSKGGCTAIARIIQCFLTSTSVYWEPFLGAAKIMQYVRCEYRYGSDIDRPIVTLLKMVQRGWQPTLPVTEEDHGLYKKYWEECSYSADPMVAFLGYGCSFGGMFFHKFIRPENNHGKDAGEETWSSLLKQRPGLSDVSLRVWDYRDGAWMETPSVIYCDVPYDGTQACGSVKEKFDSSTFWDWALSQTRHSTVLVSEYDCPYSRAVVVWQKEAQTRAGNNHDRKTKRKTEKLFLLNPDQAHKVGFNVH